MQQGWNSTCNLPCSLEKERGIWDVFPNCFWLLPGLFQPISVFKITFAGCNTFGRDFSSQGGSTWKNLTIHGRNLLCNDFNVLNQLTLTSPRKVNYWCLMRTDWYDTSPYFNNDITLLGKWTIPKWTEFSFSTIIMLCLGILRNKKQLFCVDSWCKFDREEINTMAEIGNYMEILGLTPISCCYWEGSCGLGAKASHFS